MAIKCSQIKEDEKDANLKGRNFKWRKFYEPKLSITIVGLFSCELPSSVEGLKSGKHR